MIDRNPESYSRTGDMLPYVGVVENTSDPLQAGRVQIRAIGFHPEKADGGVPTDHLPWAFVCLPTTASGVSGVGSTHGLTDGSWVFGFFLDGRDAMQPIVVGSFQGSPGFSSLQSEYIASGLGISSTGPGGLSSAFQTISAKVAGGLGQATKFGATVGSYLSLANMLGNSDALKTLEQFIGIGGQSTPSASTSGAAKIMDSAAASTIKSAVISTASAGLGAQALLGLPQVITGLFSAGGATGFPSGIAGSPLSGAAFGSTTPVGQSITANSVTVDVKTDYDSLVGSAGQDTGLLTVHSTDTPKNKKYSIQAISGDSGDGVSSPAGAHLAIDQTGQIIKIRELNTPGDHVAGMSSLSVGGQPMGNIGIVLVGGRDQAGGRDAPIDAKFYPAQMATLHQLVDAFVKKFPKMVISGANELAGTSSPGFNVSEWASAIWPENINTAMGGVKKIAGAVTGTVGASVLSEVSGLTSGSGVGSQAGVGPSMTGNKRGFVGGPTRPNPAYAARREPDVPAIARGNALTMGLGLVSMAAGSGSPLQQYLAKLEEPSMWLFDHARRSDTLDARSLPRNWRAPVRPHGGEYGRAHVVRSTEGGHHILLDDTPGRQKVELMHSTGSMLQIHADGSGQFYIKKDGHEIVLGDKYIGVNGGLKISVGGDMTVAVKGNLNYDVGGDITFNGAADMHELIRGDRSTVTEGSHLFQAKKNATHRVGKDFSTQVGGKWATAVQGVRHDVTTGNASETVRGERSEFIQGNKTGLVMGTVSEHAKNIISQSQGDVISVAGGNAMLSAKGKVTVIGDGDAIVQSGAGMKVIAAGATTIQSAAAMALIGSSTKVTATGQLDLAGSTILSSTTINLGGTAASTTTGTTTSTVDAPPASLTRESNPADSGSNLNSEQTTQGEIDSLQAQDLQGEQSGTGSGSPSAGGLNSSGGTGASSPAFNQATGGLVSATPSLGNHAENACAIANDLVSKGWSKEGASAITGHMLNESSLDPTRQVVDSNGLMSGGLIQWNGPRLQALKNYANSQGTNWQTMTTQTAFLDYEARGTMSGRGGAGLIGASDMESAILQGGRYESFAGWDQPFTGGNWGTRASDGLGVFNTCFGGNVQTVGGQAASTSISGYPGGSTGSSSGSDSTGGAPGGGTGADSSSVSSGTGDRTSNPSIRGPRVSDNGGDSRIDWGKKVSEHYTLGQLCPTSKFTLGSNPTPYGSIDSDTLIKNLSGCAVNVVEALLSHFGRCTVMCGYRSLAHNNALRARSSGVAFNSDHIYGRATDIIIPGVAPRAVADWVLKNLPFVAGVGRYPTFTHVSFYLEGNSHRIRQWGSNG